MKKTFYLLLTFLLCFVLMGNVKAVEKPVTPTIGSASDSFTYYELGKYYYEVGVNITDYLTQEETYTADGYELYYVVGPCKVNNSCQETLNGGYGIDEVAQIGLELGDSKTMY